MPSPGHCCPATAASAIPTGSAMFDRNLVHDLLARKHQLKKALAAKQAELDALADSYSVRTDQMARAHKAELERINRCCQESIEEAKGHEEKETARLHRYYRAMINKLAHAAKLDLDNAVARVSSAHDDHVAELKRIHDRNAEKLRKRLERKHRKDLRRELRRLQVEEQMFRDADLAHLTDVHEIAVRTAERRGYDMAKAEMEAVRGLAEVKEKVSEVKVEVKEEKAEC